MDANTDASEPLPDSSSTCISSSLPLVHGASRVCLDNTGANPGVVDSRCQGNGLSSHTVTDSMPIVRDSDTPDAPNHIVPHVRNDPVVDSSMQVDNTELDIPSSNPDMSTYGVAVSFQEPVLDSTASPCSSSSGGRAAPDSTHVSVVLESVPEVATRPGGHPMITRNLHFYKLSLCVLCEISNIWKQTAS
ncbi:hypothetical protein V6N13_098517 [Hibiscus sabdariffa]